MFSSTGGLLQLASVRTSFTSDVTLHARSRAKASGAEIQAFQCKCRQADFPHVPLAKPSTRHALNSARVYIFYGHQQSGRGCVLVLGLSLQYDLVA